jgi:uncharacterized protein YjcR
MTFNRKPDGRHRRSKLTAESACQVFWDKHAGMSETAIAAKHGVSPSAVREVLAHRTWSNETVEVRRELMRLKNDAQKKDFT